MNLKGTHAITIALSIAMLGSTIVVSYGAQQAEAVKPDTPKFCYEKTNPALVVCFSTRSDCNDAAERDPFAIKTRCDNINKFS